MNGYVSDISAGHIVMSEIYFFRHGQASFGEENYDRLSPLGVRQAQVLARYLAKAGKVFDAVYYGEMERQQKTAREIVNHFHQNKLPVPRPETSDAFNEYDSFAVWQALIPEMIEEQPSLLGLSDKMTLAISWQLMNASITRIKYNSQGIMLAGFNEVIHLELEGDARLLTYR